MNIKTSMQASFTLAEMKALYYKLKGKELSGYQKQVLRQVEQGLSQFFEDGEEAVK